MAHPKTSSHWDDAHFSRADHKGLFALARYFLFGLILLPIIEIALFIKVGQTIGLLPTLALVIGAAILGGLLLRQQGVSVLTRMRGNLNAGQMPGREIADAMMIGIASVFLVLPGFLSDIVALLLLLPPVRSWIYAGLARRVTVVNTANYRPGYRAEGGPQVRGPATIDLDDEDYRPK